MAGPFSYRVIPLLSVEQRLELAPPTFLALLLEYVYPILMAEPTETAGPFRITWDPPYYQMDLPSEGGEIGFVLYQVLEDEKLVLLIDFAWDRLEDLFK